MGQPGKPSVVFSVAQGGKIPGGGTKTSTTKQADVKLIKELKELNEFLSSRSYLENGACATAADFAQLAATPAITSGNEFPHAHRWYQHIRFLESRRQL